MFITAKSCHPFHCPYGVVSQSRLHCTYKWLLPVRSDWKGRRGNKCALCGPSPQRPRAGLRQFVLLFRSGPGHNRLGWDDFNMIASFITAPYYIPENTTRWPVAGLTLVQRRWRCNNVKPETNQCLVFVGICRQCLNVMGSPDGPFCPVVARNSEVYCVRISSGSHICHRGFAFIVLQTV